jgi:hypothetical protein
MIWITGLILLCLLSIVLWLRPWIDDYGEVED